MTKAQLIALVAAPIFSEQHYDWGANQPEVYDFPREAAIDFAVESAAEIVRLSEKAARP